MACVALTAAGTQPRKVYPSGASAVGSVIELPGVQVIEATGVTLFGTEKVIT